MEAGGERPAREPFDPQPEQRRLRRICRGSSLVRSLRSILREIDGGCENLRRTLPDTNVKDRTLVMLKAKHLQWRENYVRELSALLDGRE